MAVMTVLMKAVVRQFGHPHGVAGSLAGWVMGHRPSNIQRNRWVVSLLAVQPADIVLEIGFGPGIAIAELRRRIGPAGHIYGIDHSYVMLQQATARNRAAIRSGQVTLRQASVEALPTTAIDGPFDAILAVNSVGFWPAPIKNLEDLRRWLKPGGRIAVASQPRTGRRGITPAEVAREITDLLEPAGFIQPRIEHLDLEPPVVCVIAFNPEPGRDRS